MPVRGTVVQTFAGRKVLSCTATGTTPIYVALIRNSTVLVNTTNTAQIRLYEKGNYSCVATSKYGTDTIFIPVIIFGKNFRAFWQGILKRLCHHFK